MQQAYTRLTDGVIDLVENADPDPAQEHYDDLAKAQALLHQIYSRKFWKYVDKSRPIDGAGKKFKHNEINSIEVSAQPLTYPV
jgi:hypothetical protein